MDNDDFDEYGRHKPTVMLSFVLIYILLVVFCCSALVVWTQWEKLLPLLLQLEEWIVNILSNL